MLSCKFMERDKSSESYLMDWSGMHPFLHKCVVVPMRQTVSERHPVLEFN